MTVRLIEFFRSAHSVRARRRSLALELAVRHEVLPRNPMDHVSRLRREPFADALKGCDRPLDKRRGPCIRPAAGADVAQENLSPVV
jgi:hypothetical protein